MYRFYSSDRSSDYRWREVEATSFENLIETYHYNNLYTWDADNDGSDTVIFAISDPAGVTKYFRLAYEWIMLPNEEGGIHIENPFEITEISRAEAGDIPGDRDWLMIPKTFNRYR